MSKLSRGMRITAVSLVMLLVVTLLGLSLPMGGWNTFSVQTGSMEPAIKTGSLVFVHRTPVDDLRPGDVITYTNPADKTQTVTHRLLAIRTNEMGSQEFITQGDANKLPDEPVSAGQIVGSVQQHVPYLGTFTNFVLNPIGLALLIYIPAIGVVIEELKRLAAYYRSQRLYRLKGYTHQHTMSNRTLLGAKVLAGVMVVSLSVAVPAQAALRSQVTLTSSSINLVTTPVPPTTPGQCTVNSSNNVTVTSTSNQTATTGSASSTGSTTGGSATSGAATNTNNTSTTVIMNNGATCP